MDKEKKKNQKINELREKYFKIDEEINEKYEELNKMKNILKKQ